MSTGDGNRFYSPLVLNIAAKEGIGMTERYARYRQRGKLCSQRTATAIHVANHAANGALYYRLHRMLAYTCTGYNKQLLHSLQLVLHLHQPATMVVMLKR